MIVNIQDDILKLHALGLLDKLLVDKATGRRIMWATDAYANRGPRYDRNEEITPELITGPNSGIIKTRARKELEQQSNRTRQRGEVFTPLWVCRKMCDHADEMSKASSWQKYVDARVLEVTCGEAPFLVSRYDVETGEPIHISERIGILDRKLRAVSENTATEAEWYQGAIRAFQATYGYEFQGDNLLIARINLLMTFEEYLRERWNREPLDREMERIVSIITGNLWQMDGRTGAVPYREAEEACYPAVFADGKFDFIIGNPPYQDETIGSNKGFAPPIYHEFLENAYRMGSVVEMIHPARFLFRAGSTPKQWNQKMLDDPHLKVLWFEPNSRKVFAGTDIKGGVAVTCHDKNRDFGAIGVFSPYAELNGIVKKAAPKDETRSLMRMIYVQNRFDLDALYAEYPRFKEVIGSGGRDKRFRNNIFDKVPLFAEEKQMEDDIPVIGVIKNKRRWRYLPARFFDPDHANLHKWKLLVVRVNGVGALGEALSTPVVAAPGEGYTQTFIGIGAFDSREEAENALKYVKTKFVRVMLGVLKVTQDNNRDTWRLVPAQDFTGASDLDWSRPVADINRQLCRKYGLTEEETEFIELHAKEMN